MWGGGTGLKTRMLNMVGNTEFVHGILCHGNALSLKCNDFDQRCPWINLKAVDFLECVQSDSLFSIHLSVL